MTIEIAGFIPDHLARRAPHLCRMTRKSGPDPEEQAIRSAMLAARGVEQPLPVVHAGQAIGMVRAPFGYLDPRVEYLPFGRGRRAPLEKLWAAYGSYDQIITANTAGRRGTSMWSKIASTAGVANNWYDLWPVAGVPIAGTYTGAANTARALDDTAVGALYKFGNVAATYTMHLLTQWAFSTTGSPSLMLYDRVLTYEACLTTTTSAVTNTNVATAGRYAGAGLSGMQLIVTAQTALGATACAFSALSYTNEQNTGSQAMPVATSPNLIVSAAAPTANLGARVVAPATAAATTTWGVLMPKAAGDGGYRAVASYTLSAISSGTLALVLARPLAFLPLPTAGTASMVDMVQQIAGLERIYDGGCLALMLFMPTAIGPTVEGAVDMGWN